MSELQKLELRHRDRINELLSDHPPVTCELSFASLFAWRKARDMFVLDVDGSLVLLAKSSGGYIMFGPPIGSIDMRTALDEAQKSLGEPVIACDRIPEPTASRIDAAHIGLAEDRDNFDYVHRRKDLADLAGRKYHKKRNLIAQCLEKHDCSYEDLSPSLVPEIREMQDRWCATRDCKKQPGLCKEYQAIMELLANVTELDLLGGAIRIAGTIEAYAIGSRLNDDTAVEHFEKAMPAFKGLYQLMNQWFCQKAIDGYAFVNREQDVGSPGLRQAKESYFPDHMVKKFVALQDISRDEYERVKSKESRCE